MAIEVVPEQLYALARVLDGAAVPAGQVAPGLADAGGAGVGPLGPALTAFTETAATAGRCLAGELAWLAGAVAAAADSWLGLDASLLPVAGRALPR